MDANTIAELRRLVGQLDLPHVVGEGLTTIGWISERDADDLIAGRGLAGATIYPTMYEGKKARNPPKSLIPLYAHKEK